MPPAVAIAGAAVVGAGASVIASNKNSKAISKSTDAQVQAQRESLEAQLQANRESLAVQAGALNANLANQSSLYNSTGQMQSGIYNNNIGILQPYVQTGYAASDQINSLLGLPEQGSYSPKNVSFTAIEPERVTLPPTVAEAAGLNPDGTPIQNALAATPGTTPAYTAPTGVYVPGTVYQSGQPISPQNLNQIRSQFNGN